MLWESLDAMLVVLHQRHVEEEVVMHVSGLAESHQSLEGV